MSDHENETAPFDPDFDASNPYITEIPERFVVEPDPEGDLTWERLTAVVEFYNDMADAQMEEMINDRP
jgi:hypothetical protein